MIIYVVQRGDSVYSISRRFGVPMQKILDDNAQPADQPLVIGQALVINTDEISHTVLPGQSVYMIARMYDITVAQLLAANPAITNPALIYPGQVILIPVSRPRLGSIEVNGFAYPGISPYALRSTLPHLTYISIFSYEVRADGSLAPINDETIIQTARQARVAPIMVITNILEGGSFDSDLARTILTNDQVQSTLIQNVVNTLQSKNYYGLDIDFEYIYPDDRVSYNNFLRRMAETLRPLGFTISTSVAPKVSAQQRGTLYEAHDYPVHGRLMDHVIIMTYEWGYTFSTPMAVAPVDQVERVVQYAVSAIPSQKILMGMPNYGYDWTLPFVQGRAARSISNTAAVSLASRVGANIMFDERSQTPFFNYYDSAGQRHEVWFEDARSVEAKLMLVNKYNLGGVSIWTINNFFPQMWWVLNSMYNVTKLL